MMMNSSDNQQTNHDSIQDLNSIINLTDIEQIARTKLSQNAFDYYRSGATDQLTLNNNMMAFRKLQIRPRFLLNDISKRTMQTTVLGIPIRFPICVAPTAMQRMATPLGEIANAQACEAEGTIMTLSTIATSSIEEVAEATPQSPKFFQLYIYRDREITRQLVQRAEQSGFRAVVLTVDTPFVGQRYADERNKFCLPPNLRMANFEESLAESNRIQFVEGERAASGFNQYGDLFDPSLTWADVEWLRSITRLPIVVKGILTAEDARLAVEHQVDAILVSNHGGRQLDTVPATIEALIEVVDAVQGRCEVYLDGGVRRGTDVFKALAIGARAVFIGRPMIYGLACNGLDGARQVLQILSKELYQTMGLAGCTSVDDIRRSMVIKAGSLLDKL